MTIEIPFSRPSLGEEEKKAVCDVLDSGWLAAGEQVERFEQEFSDYISPPGEKYHCIFTSSCTSALKMAYKWLLEQNTHSWDFEPPSAQVQYPKNTFCATYSAAREMGVDAFTYEQAANSGSSDMARVNMHYGGVKDETPCLIEDSAHRIEPNDPLVGKIRCYSFYATKNMTTGSGGMLVTNDDDIYARCRLYWRDGLTTSTAERQSGKAGYRVEAMAGGYDGNDLAAALGRIQLGRLPDFTRRRSRIAARYNEELGGSWQGNHLYPWFVRDEEEAYRAIEFLKKCGVAAGHHYPDTGWNGVSLPLYPDLTDAQVGQVISAVKAYGASQA